MQARLKKATGSSTRWLVRDMADSEAPEFSEDDVLERSESQRTKEESSELCWQKALQLLARQDYTYKGLQRKLAESFTIKAVLATLNQAQEAGYLDDTSYATRYITYRKGERSRQEIRQELWRRGISQCDELLDTLYPLEEEGDTARVWLSKYMQRNSSVGEAAALTSAERRKLYQTMLRKGFSYSAVEEALR
ncbi:MAG: RecX family transcriptional regulator [Symbiobacteriaceae bacterium]|nr:RecX family transcriptional regulator [Symbiobacteriaceae bacterium]